MYAGNNLELSGVTLQEFAGALRINGTGYVYDTVITNNEAPSCAGFIANDNSEVTFNNMTVTGNTANATYGGGGCVFSGSLLTVNNSTISNNTAVDYGGGVYTSGVFSSFNSTISGNSAGSGGGILGRDQGDVILKFTTLTGNQAIGTIGGGIYFWGDTLDIENSIIRSNQAQTRGGGIYNAGTTVSIKASSIIDNSSVDQGGGIHNYAYGGDVLIVINSTISGNQSNVSGGGISMYSGEIHLINTTIAENTADADGGNDGNGGGIYRNSSSAHDIYLKNTILANNLDASTGTFAFVITDCDAELVSQGYNLIGVGAGTGACTITGDISGNQVGSPGDKVDPLLDTRGTNGYYTQHYDLLSGSPAIDGGTPAGCLDQDDAAIQSDQRGEVRQVGSRCDIGSVESFLGKWWLHLPLLLR
ncbi:MAG: choice-of-anchor Q domain-containing protein [Anaerolineae bacterium]|nr:choice-of-anchor Q domain-containing protein [Anaerolineae bacterium]